MSHVNDEFCELGALLKKAGLTVAEIAPVFGVSRVSVYTWISDKGPQQPVIRRQALAAIHLIERVVEAGDLPMIEVEQKDRGTVLAAIFRKHLKPPAVKES